MIIIMLRNVSDINKSALFAHKLFLIKDNLDMVRYINLYESVENFESITANQIVNIMQIFISNWTTIILFFTSEIQYSVVS